MVGQEGGNALGEHRSTLPDTDIATGWTESRADAGGLRMIESLT